MSEDEWNALWVAAQEVGAALEPFRAMDPLPQWVAALDRALEKAEANAVRNLTARVVATGWAVQVPGSPLYVDTHPWGIEEGAWVRALGWGKTTEADIAEAKRRGARAFRVEVIEVEEPKL